MSDETLMYLKQIEEECFEMADRLKLDAHRRNGLESKFKNAYASLEKKPEPVKLTVKQPEQKKEEKTSYKKIK